MGRVWAEFITDLSLYSVLMPVIIGVFRFKYLSALQKMIALLVLSTLLGEVGNFVLDKLLGNNLPVAHLFTLVQFILLIKIMEQGLHPMIPKKIFKGLLITFIIVALMDAFWWNGIYSFNSYSRPLASYIFIFLALCFFYKTLKELKIKQLELEPLFWISIGLIIYFSGSQLIFLFTNFIKTSNEALLTLWGIHAIFNIVLNITYSIALWIKPMN